VNAVYKLPLSEIGETVGERSNGEIGVSGIIQCNVTVGNGEAGDGSQWKAIKSWKRDVRRFRK